MLVLAAIPIVASLAAWFTPAAATNQPICTNFTLPEFEIRALYTDNALNAGLPANGFPIMNKLVDVNGSTWYSILSACPDCWAPWESFKMTDGVLQPLSCELSWDTLPLCVDPGKSPVFKTAYENQPGANEWCAMPTDATTEPIRKGQPLPPLQLAVHDTPGLWSICNNSTANGRRDLVFQQGATYEPQLSNCNKVTLFPVCKE